MNIQAGTVDTDTVCNGANSMIIISVDIVRLDGSYTIKSNAHPKFINTDGTNIILGDNGISWTLKSYTDNVHEVLSSNVYLSL